MGGVYKALTTLRSSWEVFTSGDTSLLSSDTFFAFSRHSPYVEYAAIVVINVSNEYITVVWQDLLVEAPHIAGIGWVVLRSSGSTNPSTEAGEPAFPKVSLEP